MNGPGGKCGGANQGATPTDNEHMSFNSLSKLSRNPLTFTIDTMVLGEGPTCKLHDLSAPWQGIGSCT